MIILKNRDFLNVTQLTRSELCDLITDPNSLDSVVADHQQIEGLRDSCVALQEKFAEYPEIVDLVRTSAVITEYGSVNKITCAETAQLLDPDSVLNSISGFKFDTSYGFMTFEIKDRDSFQFNASAFGVDLLDHFIGQVDYLAGYVIGAKDSDPAEVAIISCDLLVENIKNQCPGLVDVASTGATAIMSELRSTVETLKNLCANSGASNVSVEDLKESIKPLLELPQKIEHSASQQETMNSALAKKIDDVIIELTKFKVTNVKDFYNLRRLVKDLRAEQRSLTGCSTVASIANLIKH